jgi:uncharacterized protein
MFKKTKVLIAGMDEFLDTISQAAIDFEMGVKDYLKGNRENFEIRINTLKILEQKADSIRRRVENDLYQHSLVPQHRGDILQLFEALDDIIDMAKMTLYQMDIEVPDIPELYKPQYEDLTAMVCKAVEEIVRSARVLFREPEGVKDHIHKVHFYEKEADLLGMNLKRQIFRDESLDLSRKMHLAYFVHHIDMLADEAQEVADKLAIYSIKQVS